MIKWPWNAGTVRETPSPGQGIESFIASGPLLSSECPTAAPAALPSAPEPPALPGASVFAGLLQMKNLVSGLLIFSLPSLYCDQEIMFFL